VVINIQLIHDARSEKHQVHHVCVCVSVSVSLHGTTWLPLDRFRRIPYLRICQKSVDKIRVLLKSDE